MTTIRVTNYKDGRQKLSRGEVTVPTYYYALKRGDKAQLIRQGNSKSIVNKVSGLCEKDGQLKGNCWTDDGYYYTVDLD
jgi:hypothetical protein